MTKFVELHLIQNFAPSCLNRDDTGSPKDCQFGGVRRARISSQCFKRAIREHFKSDKRWSDKLGTRTKRLVEKASEQLIARLGRSKKDAIKVCQHLLRIIFLGKNIMAKGKPEMTQYLLFLSAKEMEAFTRIADQFWEELLTIVPPKKENDVQEEQEAPESVEEVGEKNQKTALKISKGLKEAVKVFLEQPLSIDLA